MTLLRTALVALLLGTIPGSCIGAPASQGAATPSATPHPVFGPRRQPRPLLWASSG